MIKFNLSGLLGKKRMQQTELSKKTGIRKATIFAYYHGYVKRVNVEDINKMCKVLNCKIEDILEYVPNIED